jgi:hypothetical protein
LPRHDEPPRELLEATAGDAPTRGTAIDAISSAQLAVISMNRSTKSLVEFAAPIADFSERAADIVGFQRVFGQRRLDYVEACTPFAMGV